MPIVDYGHWDVRKVGSFDPADWFGFIYLITNTVDGRKYIGKKQFKSKKRYQKNKRSRIKYVDSDWQTYCSSCDELKADIASMGEDKFKFEILHLCSGRAETSYMEEHVQHEMDVLFKHLPNGTRAFYNGTITHKVYAGVEKQMAQTKEKLSNSVNR